MLCEWCQHHSSENTSEGVHQGSPLKLKLLHFSGKKAKAELCWVRRQNAPLKRSDWTAFRKDKWAVCSRGMWVLQRPKENSAASFLLWSLWVSSHTAAFDPPAAPLCPWESSALWLSPETECVQGVSCFERAPRGSKCVCIQNDTLTIRRQIKSNTLVGTARRRRTEDAVGFFFFFLVSASETWSLDITQHDAGHTTSQQHA